MASWRRLVDIRSGWPSVDPGLMRHAITLQRFGASSPVAFDEAGPVLTWGPFATAMAAIEVVSGTDVIHSGQDTTKLFLMVAIWYQPGILPNMRVVADTGSTYLIQAIENVLEMNVVLVLTCLGLGPNE